MGVTVHFEGHARGDTGRAAAISAAKRFAVDRGWPWNAIGERKALLKRVIAEQNIDYSGPTTGVELQPHEDCEPFRLEFDRNNFCQDYCKTQFAPPEVHVQVIELLRVLQPSFDNLTVMDEGEYFESGNFERLQGHIDTCLSMMEKVKAERPGHSGPYRLSNGRIVDLTSDA